jgi:uncharacterized protein
MKQNWVAAATGFIFAIGLGLSGMTEPARIIQFLDVTDWNPSLMFVMVGAIGIHMALYPVIRKRQTPLLDVQWHVPERKDLSPSLFIGSLIFGIGWGLGGFCPGPALTSITSLKPSVLVFVATMVLGMVVYRKTEKSLPFKK